MRPTLRIALLVVALIGCLTSRLPAGKYAHPAACTRKTIGDKASCNCIQLGYPPEEHRVKTNQREEIVADWRASAPIGSGTPVVTGNSA